VPPDPTHLLQQADALAAEAAGPQTHFRRAISTAYYALFHLILTAAADMVVGPGDRTSARYAFVYRSVDHGRLRSVSQNLSGTNPDVPFVPPGGFGRIAEFARVVGNLLELRNQADYDPSRDFTQREAQGVISDARLAIVWFQEGSNEQREAFLTLLLL
jgi:hypothetical protein